jgi:ribose 5-phosphate isomerase B
MKKNIRNQKDSQHSFSSFRIAIGSDHGGYKMKSQLIRFLQGLGVEVADLGTHSPDPCDYPLIGRKVAEAVASGRFERGILLCKSGIGICIAANKVLGIRAACCNDAFDAKRSRNHNDANILVMGAEKLSLSKAMMILKIFMSEKFESGTRHERRVRQILAIEREALRRPRKTKCRT